MRRRTARRAAARALWAWKREVIRSGRITSRPEHNHSMGPGIWLGFHGTDPGHCVCNGTHLAQWCPRCPVLAYPGEPPG